MHTLTARLPYSDALPMYRQLKNDIPSCLFESASAVDKSSRMSVIGLEPTLEVVGKGEYLALRLLHPRGSVFYEFIKTEFQLFVESESHDTLRLHIPKLPFHGAEEDRLDRQNIVQPLRRVLAAFHSTDKNFMGFYGALSYQFVYQFEDLQHQKVGVEPDFH